MQPPVTRSAFRSDPVTPRFDLKWVLELTWINAADPFLLSHYVRSECLCFRPGSGFSFFIEVVDSIVTDTSHRQTYVGVSVS